MNTGLFILGVALLIIGVVLYGYDQSVEGMNFSPPDEYKRPYASLGMIILLVGLFTMVFSAFTPVTKRKTVTHVEDDVVIEKPRRRVIVKEEKV